ncbi:MAG: beta-N-acetylhexosaminidase [Pseudomonadota bacterium]
MSSARRREPGSVMLDVAGLELERADADRIAHPACGGVILFARNVGSPRQVAELVAAIREARGGPLPICIDQEGGRVQRLRTGFTQVPAMGAIGRLYDRDARAGREAARAAGSVIGRELRALDLDFSFTPVLDLDWGRSAVIGDRAFHGDPGTAALLAGDLLDGLAAWGVAGIGKHFPGHGYAGDDSHVAIPTDERPLEQIIAADVEPYARLCDRMAGVMPAHVIYPQADPHPAGFSRFWLQTVLRQRLGFSGAILSDDLAMEGASVAGSIRARAQAALEAGCDVALICNRPDLADELLDAGLPDPAPESRARILALCARPVARSPGDDVDWLQARAALEPAR